ncbi:MAG TPA: D-2-hydroxyacid dehydrogenase family protein [Reyranella sp.]|jgi:D-3-phosphoglycerate dehydrogenase
MKIAVLDDYQNAVKSLAATQKLAGHEVTSIDHALSGEALTRELVDVDAVVLNMQRTKMPADVINALPKLKFISQTGKNAGHLDLAAATARGIVVSAGGAGSPAAVSELTWGLILSSFRHIPDEVAALKGGRWQTTVGTGLTGKTLGVYAYGRIGSLVANVGSAFGMKVLVWGREMSTAKAREAGYEAASSREAFFAEADVVTLHLALNAETKGIVTAEDLGRMKPTALLVNTSRAELVAPGALVEALKRGRPGFAALDVFEQEPIAKSDPLLSMPNVIATPHLGYVEAKVYDNIYGAAFDQVAAFAAGAPINVLNPDAVGKKG